MSTHMHVTLVRHGESHWNVEKRYQGQLDSGLTDRGRVQARQAAQVLVGEVGSLEMVWSSDLPRARDTAQAYADLTGARVIEDQRLREVDVGDWSGRSQTEIAEAFPDIVAAARAGLDPRRGGGETFAEQRARVAECLEEIGGTDADRALVFTHGGAIQVAAAHAAGVPVPGHQAMAPPRNCSRTILRMGGRRPAVVRYNVPLPEGAD
jgi:broad specificity phosphatase PhoE